VSSAEGDHNGSEQKQRPCGEKMREEGLFSLEKRWLLLVAVLQYIQGYQQCSLAGFSLLCQKQIFRFLSMVTRVKFSAL